MLNKHSVGLLIRETIETRPLKESEPDNVASMCECAHGRIAPGLEAQGRGQCSGGQGRRGLLLPLSEQTQKKHFLGREEGASSQT